MGELLRAVFKLRYNSVDAMIILCASSFAGFSGYEFWHVVISVAAILVGLAISTIIGNALGISQGPAS